MLLGLAMFFLRLGLTAFGGPAAHIAMMEEHAVRRRKWMSAEEFLDLVGITSLLPGPTSTELAILIGYRLAGWPGLVLCGVCFILPAAALTLVLAWVYVRFHTLPAASHVLDAVKPVIIAVVVQAMWNLGRTAIKTRFLGFLAAAAVAAGALGVHPLALLVAAGIAAAAWRWAGRGAPPVSLLVVGGLAKTAAAPFGLGPLFVVFLKVGALLFGSGYVLIAFLRTDLVEGLGWLTERQLLDAVAIGQVTPGPVFTTATFIGYFLGGFPGAAVATLAIFLPAFVLVALSRGLAARLRSSPGAAAFLDGVNVGSLALMAVVAVQLGQTALVSWMSIAIAVVAAVLLLWLRINSVWLILAAAVSGLVVARMM
jgi:chromate transporter